MMHRRSEGGLFIAFEGLDGSGSAIQASMLYSILRKEGYRVYLTKEPSNGLIGGLLRAGLSGEWFADPRTRQLLFTADRSQQLEKEIKPKLEAGKIVIIDRYIMSSIAYGSHRINDLDWLENINSQFIIPDITFYINSNPKICALRIKKSYFGLEMYKEEKELISIAKTYKKMVKTYDRVFEINGDREEMEITREIIKIVKKSLEKNS